MEEFRAFYEWLHKYTKARWLAIKLWSHLNIDSPHRCEATPQDGPEFMRTDDGWACKRCFVEIDLPDELKEVVKVTRL